MKTLKDFIAILTEIFWFLTDGLDYARFFLAVIALIIILAFCGFFTEVSAAALTVCRVNDAPGVLLRFSYAIDYAPIAWYHYAEGGYWTHTTEWGGEAVISDYARGYAEYLVLDYGDSDYRVLRGDRNTAFCNAPGGDLPTITKWDVRGNWFTWEVQDDYGNWHTVRDSTGIVVTPVEWAGAVPFSRLVLGRDNPVLDPLRYRVTVRG